MRQRLRGELTTSNDRKVGPNMSKESIFAGAVEIACPQVRATYLRDQCGDDVELLRNIQGLVVALFDANDHGFLNSAHLSTESLPMNLQSGDTINGKFRLVRRLGGAQGFTWEAWDTDLQRKAVVKFPKEWNSS